MTDTTMASNSKQDTKQFIDKIQKLLALGEHGGTETEATPAIEPDHC